MSDDVYDALRARNIALCIADSEARETPVVMTANYAYLRLRDEGYAMPTSPLDADGADVGRHRVGRVRLFKHEDEGKGSARSDNTMLRCWDNMTISDLNSRCRSIKIGGFADCCIGAAHHPRAAAATPPSVPSSS